MHQFLELLPTFFIDSHIAHITSAFESLAYSNFCSNNGNHLISSLFQFRFHAQNWMSFSFWLIWHRGLFGCFNQLSGKYLALWVVRNSMGIKQSEIMLSKILACSSGWGSYLETNNKLSFHCMYSVAAILIMFNLHIMSWSSL